jgi:hypothetical protein
LGIHVLSDGDVRDRDKVPGKGQQIMRRNKILPENNQSCLAIKELGGLFVRLKIK